MPPKKKLDDRKKILVQLFDADGCVFNPVLFKKRQEAFVLPSAGLTEFFIVNGNRALFDAIQHQIEEVDADKLIVMSGSNRQSNALDAENAGMNKTGSFFPVLTIITHYLTLHHSQASLNTFLLADLFCNLPIGTAFAQALSAPDTGMHPNCPLEESKILWMYAVLHYLASVYPRDEYELICYFYDDKLSILEGLNEWLSNNPHLMPDNIRLMLNHYDGGEQLQPYSPMIGQGKLDAQYSETVKMLACSAGVPPNFDWSQCPRNQKIRLTPTEASQAVIEILPDDWSEVLICGAAGRGACVPNITFFKDRPEDEDDEPKLRQYKTFAPKSRGSADSSATTPDSGLVCVESQLLGGSQCFERQPSSGASVFPPPVLEEVQSGPGSRFFGRRPSSTASDCVTANVSFGNNANMEDVD